MPLSRWNPLSWVEWLRALLADVSRSAPKAIFPSARPQLEELEARLVPTVTVGMSNVSTGLNSPVAVPLIDYCTISPAGESVSFSAMPPT